MNVQQAKWAIPGILINWRAWICYRRAFANGFLVFKGAVPNSLFAVLEREDEANRPVKRRKANSGSQNLRQLNGVSEAGVPNGYIPLARATLLFVCIQYWCRASWPIR